LIDFFLDVPLEERISRSQNHFREVGKDIPYDDVLAMLNKRDEGEDARPRYPDYFVDLKDYPGRRVGVLAEALYHIYLGLSKLGKIQVQGSKSYANFDREIEEGVKVANLT